MHDRLTIIRPVALGEDFARAVRRTCDRHLALAVDHLTLLDARLACGDFEAVLAVIRAAAPDPALPLFLARYVRWAGDLQSAASAWDSVVGSLELLQENAVEPELRRASFLQLAPVATDLGDAPLAARLLGSARLIGGAAHPEVPTGGAPDGPVAVSAPAHAAITSADADATLILDVVSGTLGIEPDAARGRLRLRPRLDRLDELDVRQIRFGDGSVSLSAVFTAGPTSGGPDTVDRGGDRLVIRVEQEAGSMPMTVLLEPFVRRVGTATVDGRPADLAPQSVAGAVTVPVQLVLDEARTLVLSVPRTTKTGRSRE
ncbi:MAG: hypothetical protein KFH98_09045 [Gemmatimonadetes bacterium]|nr:hypothetical protein [Gemmatimonadota bacterium]